MWTMDPPASTPISLEPIETEEQARNYVLELTTATEQLRFACDVAVSVKVQRTAFLRWLVARGDCIGALRTLKRVRLLSDSAYTELRARVSQTQVPTVQQGVLPFLE